MGLRTYKTKRNFARTSEPKGGKPKPKGVKGASRFVIQKHDASRLHYDFRLQMEGVLKSWAVPKGFPWVQGEKHLAVEVEDHPIEYEDFEGVIPKGNYGGGTVMVWDRGTYYVYGEQPSKSLRDGKLHLVLDGKKAKGEWTLVRIRSDSQKNQWLLLKTGTNARPPSKKQEDQSAKTGRTMKQIAGDRDAEWESDRDEPTKESTPGAKSILRMRIKAALKKKEVGGDPATAGHLRPNKPTSDCAGKLANLPSAKPRFIQPMKPRLVEKSPSGGDWSYELKFDGIRACAVKDDGKVNLTSRNGKELRSRFGEITNAIKELPIDECVIDGEVVALDEQGRSSFQLLQALEMEGRKPPVRFYVFDLLQLNRKSLLHLPLMQRKQLLARICESVADPIRYSGEIGSDAKSLLAEVKRRGLEGLIGKLGNSVYEPGRRSGSWIKLKCVNEQEFVIGGYTPPAGSRKHFGAVLVGYYTGNRLMFAGKVGTGFTARSLSILHNKFRAEERDDCPFVELPLKQNGKWVQGITPSEMRKCTWIHPVFVCEIKFAEWTRDGKLRQPVFVGLREDKNPKDVVREA